MKKCTYLINNIKNAIVSILLCIYAAAVVIFIHTRIAFQEEVFKSDSVFLFEWNHQLVTQTKEDKLTRETELWVLFKQQHFGNSSEVQ